MKKIVAFSLIFFSLTTAVMAQAGIAVTPGRVYYHLEKGQENTQTVKVTNPTDRELEIGVSFSDWNYHSSGNNNIQEPGTLPNSCSDWIQILPDTYFILKAGETKDIEVVMNVPQTAEKSVPVHTAMLFFTQLNPGKATDKDGASIQVTVRMGVKIYHSFSNEGNAALEIVDFKNYKDDDGTKMVEINVKNTGDLWTSGTIAWELFNKNTGKSQTLVEREFHTLPDDLRIVKQALPDDLEKGNYTLSAVLTYGDSDTINIAELDFSL